MKIKNEADFMDNVITQRKQDIDNIATIMSDINAIANDIAKDTAMQGEKLQDLDSNLIVAEANTEEALHQLNQAKVHQKKGGKCMMFLVGLIFMSVIILGLILAF